MKKLEKLNAKRITKIETILGGAGPYEEMDFSFDDGTPTTSHKPSKGNLQEHYECDHAPDTIK